MTTLQWRDWSCSVRVVLADGRSRASAPDEERLVRGLMNDVARSVDRFTPTSDLSRVNAAAGRLIPVRPLTLELVELALATARDTGGACDPTVGRHLLAAGYDADIDVLRTRPISHRTPATVSRRADWRTVRVDRSLRRLGLPAGLALDLGATAKAWTADEAAARLQHATGMAALVALGGDIAARGQVDWRVLVSEDDGGPGQIVIVREGGLATSSTQARRWRGPYGERHHVIDPGTGAPTTGQVRTASVLAPSCVAANALSTAALVWGATAPDRLRAHAARLVDAHGSVTTTATWPVDRSDEGTAA
ncbi:FAD:protein FMN transferase [Nocardioides sp. L-11A]|uniref:FAD:protein FMN transferase n=1 Tax=Nocardioides sp. L-11A TaxID=3043848 RepID=UPI00249BD5F1|nr:FAD:protein FMN transferase [Nocardioides sp. L-11A]